MANAQQLIAHVRVTGHQQAVNALHQVSSAFRQAGAAASSLRSPFVGLTGLLGAVGLGAGAANILKSAVSMQTLEIGLRAVSSSAQEAEVAIARMRDVAKMPGLGFREAIEGFTRLRASGFSAQTSERALRAFGNALATVGKGREDLEGVIMALSQISAKGRVSAEEINQLGERVFQIRAVMERAFGTANTELLQRMNITPAQFIERIITELEKLPRVAGGAQNSIDNLIDAFDQAKTALGQAFLPLLTKSADELARLLNVMRETNILTEIGQKLAAFFGQGLGQIFSGGLITGGLALFLALLESVPDILSHIMRVSRTVFMAIHDMLIGVYNRIAPLFRELFNIAARAINLYRSIEFGVKLARGESASFRAIGEIAAFKPATTLWQAITSGQPGGPLDFGYNLRAQIGRRTEQIMQMLSRQRTETALPDWSMRQDVMSAASPIQTLSEIAQNTRETAQNTRPDLRRYALGGGALGQIGITPIEMVSIQRGAQRPVTVVLQGGKTFEQMLSQAITEVVLQMQRQGALR